VRKFVSEYTVQRFTQGYTETLLTNVRKKYMTKMTAKAAVC